MAHSTTDYRTWAIETCLICDIKNNEEWIPSKVMFSKEEVQSEILFESDKFFIIADIGPIFEGYYLINLKRHVPSMAFLKEDESKELNGLKKLVRNVSKYPYGNVIFFEHGAKSFSRGAGCCIDHAHIHAVPVKKDILSLLQTDFSFVETSFEYILELKGKKEYLYYEDIEGKMYISETNDPNLRIPTQYFRRILANMNNQNTFWNWRDYVRFADAINTKQKIINARLNFEKNLKMLNKIDLI